MFNSTQVHNSGWKNLKLTPKIAGSIAVTLALTSAIGFFISQRRVNAQAEDASALALELERIVRQFTLRGASGKSQSAHSRAASAGR